MFAETRERRRFTVGEVARMVETGVLREGEPVELLEGELIVVPQQGPEHASRVAAIGALLARRYTERSVRCQLPLEVGVDSLPEPDAAVMRGTDDAYATRHPRGDEAVLVIEVARSSQAVDRAKARLYAKAGVPVYWLLDLVARRLEERTEPNDAGDYRLMRLYTEQDDIVLPELGETISVAALLGPEPISAS